MRGFQVTFYTGQLRVHRQTPMSQWLLGIARRLSITGVTVAVGAEGIGRDGRLHSAHFFDLADQPVEVTMAVTDEQCALLFEVLEKEEANVFYVKTPVEFGVVGRA